MSGPRAVSGHEGSSTGGLEASEAPAERVDVGAKSGGGFDETGGEQALAVPSSGPAAETADDTSRRDRRQQSWQLATARAPAEARAQGASGSPEAPKRGRRWKPGGVNRSTKRVVRSSETWAQSVVAEATGACVHVHDDGSEPSMYDLRVGPAADPDVAIEVTGAVDPEFTATWNTGPATRALMLPLRGDWSVTIQPGTYVNQIAPQLEALLRLIEADQNREIGLPIDYVLRRHNQRIYDAFEAIGVTYVVCA